VQDRRMVTSDHR